MLIFVQSNFINKKQINNMTEQKPQKIISDPKGQKTVQGGEKKISQARAKLGSFYDFKVDQKKLQTIKQRTWKHQRRIFFMGIVFGFFTEYLLGNTKIYENIVRKATMRRLNAKKKQDDLKEQKYQRRLEKEKKQQQEKKASSVV